MSNIPTHQAQKIAHTHPQQLRADYVVRTAAQHNLPNLPTVWTDEPQTMAFNKAAFSNLSAADQHLFETFGQGPVAPAPWQCIHHPFELYAATQPDVIAAEHLDNTITYRDLDRHANRLASMLAAHGVQPGDNVGLFLRRSIPMMVGLMATLKAGAAYVPQDVKVVPTSHLQHIADVTAAKVILTTAEFKHLVPEVDGVTCIVIDEVMAQPFMHPAQFTAPFVPVRPTTAADRCFILFTSGTTGNPNGVQVTHGNVTNIILTQPGDLGIKPGMRVGQILSISFDMSAWEILGCFSHGATLVIRGRDFSSVVETVDVIIATPSVLGSFDAEKCTQVQTVAVAGEPCPKPLADKWSQFCNFYNSCGPTETTIVNTAQLYQPDSHLTIGKPTPNNTVYILDQEMRPCAIGETGEMWAGGECVTAGYLGNADLTAARYADDPFLGHGRKMFRTRDLGRWTEDGQLEHFGRTDDQVKVRGFRVELDSVSGALESVPDCAQAVTLKYDSRDLVAFVRPATVDPEAAKQAVDDALPYYCIPAQVIALDTFPLTSRGKLDKRALMTIAAAHMA